MVNIEPDEFVFNILELWFVCVVKCTVGIDVDDVDVFTVLTFASDSDKSFLTAHGDWVPFNKYF